MPKFVALLRGINVGGRNLIGMADLRAMAESMKLENPKTLLQSGNLIFECAENRAKGLEAELAAQTSHAFKLEIVYIVRSATEWRAIVSANPMKDEARRDPSHTVLMCTSLKPEAKAIKDLRAAIPGAEVMHAHNRELYFYYPKGIGVSKLTNALIERKLGVRGTARNWNTVLKLAALLD